MKRDDILEFKEYIGKAECLLELAEHTYLETHDKQEALKKYNSAYNMYELAEAFARDKHDYMLSKNALEGKNYCDKRINEISALIKLDSDYQR